MREAPQFHCCSRNLRRAGRWCGLLIGVFLLMAWWAQWFPGRAQTAGQTSSSKAAPMPVADSHPDSADPVPVDSQRLLQLADRLQAEMAKTTPDQLSIPVLRQADAIEKLAHQMRNR